MTPQRRRLLLELLHRLGLDPAAPAGPGSSDSALAPIEEALSHRSAGRPVDHEQLEFLGDAVLRLAASLYLRRHHPQLSVGQSSALIQPDLCMAPSDSDTDRSSVEFAQMDRLFVAE